MGSEMCIRDRPFNKYKEDAEVIPNPSTRQDKTREDEEDIPNPAIKTKTEEEDVENIPNPSINISIHSQTLKKNKGRRG